VKNSLEQDSWQWCS